MEILILDVFYLNKDIVIDEERFFFNNVEVKKISWKLLIFKNE